MFEGNHSNLKQMSISKSQTTKILKDFCALTSLHGYSYLFISDSIVSKIIWGIVIVTMTGLGIGFLVSNTNDYLDSRIVTQLSSKNLSVSNR